MKNEQADVVIIGGGVIGTSIAWHLARRNLSVVLLEKRELAAGASGACDGLVFLQSKKPGIHLQMAMEGKKRFEALAGMLPLDVEYKNCGGLVVIESDAEYEAMEAYVRQQRETGLSVSLLDGAEAREREPALAEGIRGAAWSDMDGQVNPIALTLGFARAAALLGAEIRSEEAAVGIEVAGGRVAAVRTESGRVRTPVVINAAGVYAPEIGRMVGLDIPIRPRRGQLLVTEPVAPMLKSCLISASYIAAKFNPELEGQAAKAVSVEQSEGGTLLLGSTREFVDYDTRTTTEGLAAISRNAGRVLPGLKGMRIIRAFAGLRPYTPDGLPILGGVERVPGLVMAAGHEGDGIALSAITGELVAQLVDEGESRIPLTDFRLERFGEAKNNPS